MKWLLTLLASLFVLVAVAATQADEPQGKPAGTSAQLEAAKKRATDQTFKLRYRFSPGEKIRWKVVHLGTTETTIQGNTQTSKARTISTKVWTVQNVADNGNITFVHSVSRVNMWQKVTGRPEVRYDSDTDKTPPPEYVQVAKTVGVPLATVTISPTGTVIKRDHGSSQLSFGLGNIAMPLPEQAVRIGYQWSTPNEVQVRRADGQVKRVKTRLVYTLKSVKTGVATIDVETEVLTPIQDPKIRSQLVQQITNGEVRFDLDAGRIMSRQVDWDETVVGFNGSGSLMKYLARFTEELIPGDETARKSATTSR